MKKILSLLAIALVSSLFAAGCGKTKSCPEADNKGEANCVNPENFENGLQCKWEADKTEGAKADAGKCTPWTPDAAAVTACGLGSANEDACKAAVAGVEGHKCSWNDKATPKCQATKAQAEKKKAN